MLKLQDLTLHYGHSQILHGVSIEARAGEVTCIMGTNGVGKTSLSAATSVRAAQLGHRSLVVSTDSAQSRGSSRTGTPSGQRSISPSSSSAFR